jgi:hypothetical protein
MTFGEKLKKLRNENRLTQDELPENPYVEDSRDVRCVSFSPNGDVLGGNVYRNDIMEIIKDYEP